MEQKNKAKDEKRRRSPRQNRVTVDHAVAATALLWTHLSLLGNIIIFNLFEYYNIRRIHINYNISYPLARRDSAVFQQMLAYKKFLYRHFEKMRPVPSVLAAVWVSFEPTISKTIFAISLI